MVDIGKSITKVFINAALFAGGALLAAFLDTPEAAIPLGAIATGAWNYVKHYLEERNG